MARAKALFGDVFFYSVGSFLALVAYALISNGAGYLPGWIDRMWPIIGFGYVDRVTGKYEAAVQEVFRDEEHLCWSVFTEKLHSGIPVKYDFFLEGGDTSARIPTSAYLVDARNEPLPGSDKIAGKLRSRPVGSQWKKRYCIDVAGRIPDFKTITVTGYGTHQRWPYRWNTITELPPFIAAALVQGPPKGSGR